jgi:hypothetical protein
MILISGVPRSHLSPSSPLELRQQSIKGDFSGER